MLKFLILLTLTTAIFLQAVCGFCSVSRTVAFQLSVTIPPHVILNGPSAGSSLNNSYQITQTQTVIRNNKTISLTTIVVP